LIAVNLDESRNKRSGFFLATDHVWFIENRAGRNYVGCERPCTAGALLGTAVKPACGVLYAQHDVLL
jgi:hypothetical protein